MDCNRLHSVSRTIAQSLVVILAAFLFLPPQPARADDLFDPARHMRISEIKPGMRGYGLTVMRGTAIERFEVEVLSILHNFNPQGDVILVRCSGLDLEHTGAIAGMSGSPIYLDDGSGNARMAGAFAYGWQLMKDPVGGVQPVEYMLKLPAEVRTPATQPAKNNTASINTTRWNVAEAMSLPYSKDKAVKPLKARQGTSPQVDTSRLRPLLTPLMVSGLSQPQIDRLSDLLGIQGMATLQAGGTSTAPADLDPADAEVKLEPGSAIAVPLVTGDLDLTAIGTVTEVIGNRVYGFGHPFNSEGDVKLPMGTGRINGVIANYMTSFKLGSMIQATGTLASDQMVGIAGTVGAVPETIPLELRVVYDDGSLDKTYHFQVSSHPLLTPRLLPGVAATVVTAQHELPVHHSVDSDIVIDFEGGRQVAIRSKSAGMSIMPMYFNLAGAIATAADNPFETVLPVKMHGTVRIASTTNEAHILSVNVPRTEYRPGQSVRAFITYRPFRSDEKTMPVEMELPRDLPDGDYTLTISDAYSYLSEEQSLAPYRFTAEDIDEVFDVIHDITSIDESAIYIRLLRQQDGVAIGRTALPHLPSSRQQVLLGAGRSNMTPLVSSTVKQIPTDVLMSGAVQFQIKVNRNARIDTASATSQPTPATTAAGSN